MDAFSLPVAWGAPGGREGMGSPIGILLYAFYCMHSPIGIVLLAFCYRQSPIHRDSPIGILGGPRPRGRKGAISAKIGGFNEF